jgi:hypothetical protein
VPLKVKYIPKGLVKVNKYNLTNIFIKDSIIIVILIVILIIYISILYIII